MTSNIYDAEEFDRLLDSNADRKSDPRELRDQQWRNSFQAGKHRIIIGVGAISNERRA